MSRTCSYLGEIDWNEWAKKNGIGGRNRMELGGEIKWNQWARSTGICTFFHATKASHEEAAVQAYEPTHQRNRCYIM